LLSKEKHIDAIIRSASRYPTIPFDEDTNQALGTLIRQLDFEPRETTEEFDWRPRRTTFLDSTPPAYRALMSAPNVKFLNIGTSVYDLNSLNIYDYIPTGVEHLYVGHSIDNLSLPQFVTMMERLDQMNYLAPPGIRYRFDNDAHKDGEVNWEGIVWPNIRELVFDKSYDTDRVDMLGRLIPSGVFSCLDRLSFNGRVKEGEFVRFLRAHGQNLKAFTMAIYDPYPGTMPTTAMLIAVRKLCPWLMEISLVVQDIWWDENQPMDWPIAEIDFPLVTTLGLQFVEDMEAGEDLWGWFLDNALRWMRMVPNMRTVRFYDEQNLDWLQSPDAACQFGKFLDGCRELGVASVEDNFGTRLTPNNPGTEV